MPGFPIYLCTRSDNVLGTGTWEEDFWLKGDSE